MNTVDNTPCLFCEIPYLESGVLWLWCKNCNFWVCETCAGRAAKQEKSSFVQTVSRYLSQASYYVLLENLFGAGQA